MGISKKDVDYVASLARLEFNEKDKENLTKQLESILGYIEKITEVDTPKIEPTSHGLTGHNVWRQDQAVKTPKETIERLFKNAPETDGDFFKVKKVIENED